MSQDEPFGRQPKPISVIFMGEPEDIAYWLHLFMRIVEHKGNFVQKIDNKEFRIYPRAVND